MMSANLNTSNCENCSMGQIQVIFGPMFSGKSTELLRRMRRYKIARYDCVLIKYTHDDRYDKDQVSTHDQQKMPAVNCNKLFDIEKKVLQCDVVGIDEGQFFSDVVAFAEKIAEMGKIVIIAALDATFQKKPFGDVLGLIPIAESVVKLSAVCHECNSEASFTKRISQETAVEVIGGSDKYIATCRNCFKSPMKKFSEIRQMRSPLRPIQPKNITLLQEDYNMLEKENVRQKLNFDTISS